MPPAVGDHPAGRRAPVSVAGGLHVRPRPQRRARRRSSAPRSTAPRSGRLRAEPGLRPEDASNVASFCAAFSARPDGHRLGISYFLPRLIGASAPSTLWSPVVPWTPRRVQMGIVTRVGIDRSCSQATLDRRPWGRRSTA